MPTKSLAANIVATSRKPRPAKHVAAHLATEVLTLQRWLERDPRTPYRHEAAARIRQLAAELERDQ